MEKKTNKKALLISLIFALIACALVYTMISKQNKPDEVRPKVKILVATRNINAGEKIQSQDINTIDVSEDSLPAGVVNDRKNIEGFYAREPIIMGEPFRKERLTEADELALSFNIPEDMRAFTVYVNEDTLFSNQLRVGDRVDVIGNFEVEAYEGKNVKTSKIFLQNIEVLAIGSNRIKKNTEGAGANTTDESQLPKTVTLSVTPVDAEKMAFASNYASYTFALRGNKDDKNVLTPGTIIDQLVPHLLVR